MLTDHMEITFTSRKTQGEENPKQERVKNSSLVVSSVTDAEE